MSRREMNTEPKLLKLAFCCISCHYFTRKKSEVWGYCELHGLKKFFNDECPDFKPRWKDE